MITIHRVAVIGAGNMGSQIAGYLAGLGITIDLFDLEGKARSAKAKMVKDDAVYSAADVHRITSRTIGKDDAILAKAHWIVEVVFEDLGTKQEIFARIEEYRHPDTIVTSNTSGISIEDMTAGRSDSFRKHFFVTHFFNPVGSLPLLELVPGEDTDEDLFDDFAGFATCILNKGVVIGKDTPNFVANRYGGLALILPLRFWPDGMSVEDVDEIWKILTGWAPLKTWDIVGISLFSPVAGNVYSRVKSEEDPFLQHFYPENAKINQLLALGYNGRKSKAGSGFFAKKGDTKLMFDFATGTYVPATVSTCYPSLTAALAEKNPMKRGQILLSGSDPAADFAHNCFFRLMAYAPFLVGKVCDTIVDLDRAMEWGFAWPMGPFKIMQTAGLAQTIEGIRHVGCATLLPEGFGDAPLYDNPMQPTVYRSLDHGEEVRLPIPEELLVPDKGRELYRNEKASVVEFTNDLVVLVTFHSGAINPAGEEVLDAINTALDYAEEYGCAVVVGSTNARAFCGGADLKLVLQLVREKNFTAIEKLVRKFQEVTQRMTYSSIPVITAPHGLTLGGGSEIAMASNRVVANNAVTWSQPELGVGLIAAAGGCLRTLRIALQGIPHDVMWGKDWGTIAGPFIDHVWRTHTWCKQSKSGRHARDLGFLRPEDEVIYSQGMGQAYVLWRAAQVAGGMLQAGFTPLAPTVFNLPGEALFAKFALECDMGAEGHHFPLHNAMIAKKIAWVLCGGGTKLGQEVTEQDILDCEREAFMSLVGTEETEHMIARVVGK